MTIDLRVRNLNNSVHSVDNFNFAIWSLFVYGFRPIRSVVWRSPRQWKAWDEGGGSSSYILGRRRDTIAIFPLFSLLFITKLGLYVINQDTNEYIGQMYHPWRRAIIRTRLTKRPALAAGLGVRSCWWRGLESQAEAGTLPRVLIGCCSGKRHWQSRLAEKVWKWLLLIFAVLCSVPEVLIIICCWLVLLIMCCVSSWIAEHEGRSFQHISFIPFICGCYLLDIQLTRGSSGYQHKKWKMLIVSSRIFICLNSNEVNKKSSSDKPGKANLFTMLSSFLMFFLDIKLLDYPKIL